MWYTPEHTISHNALINMVIGPRGCGKTYGLKNKAIKNYISKSEKFIYLRRYQAELDLVKDTVFNDINLNESYGRITFKNGEYYIENEDGEKELCGYAMALSTSNQVKSASFPDVTLIIFDEFIIDETQNQRYLKNEVRKFLDFVETVARMRENISCFLLANSLSFINPYTLFWELEYKEGSQFIKTRNKLVLVELYMDEEYKTNKKRTRFGQLIDGTEYEQMSVNNAFILDTNNFIEKRPKTAKYDFTFIVRGNKYGVWHDYNTQVLYVDEKVDPSCLITICASMEDHLPDYLIMTRKNPYIELMIKLFRIGKVRFQNQKVKKEIMSTLKSYI